ncbi:hypothetical protein ACHAWF_014873 [Thalassiosira exigua]
MDQESLYLGCQLYQASQTLCIRDVEDLLSKPSPRPPPSKHNGRSPKCVSRHLSSSASSTSEKRVAPTAFLESYRAHVAERISLAGGDLGGVPPRPLDAAQTTALVEAIKNLPPPSSVADLDASEDVEFLVDLLTHRVPPGVDEAAKVKAAYLRSVALGEEEAGPIGRVRAVELLGTMKGGYNVGTLVELLSHGDPDVRERAAEQLKHTLLVYDAFNDVNDLRTAGPTPEARAAATSVLESWADAEWFESTPPVPDMIAVTVFKVPGETNTDDLSPAQDAWSRPDIPLHALAMLKHAREGVVPEANGAVGPLGQMEELRKRGRSLAYVGDVVGTGSSRKSAANSLIWHAGEDIPFVPNVRRGGVCLGGKIAPIFFNTLEDSGALPIEMDVSTLNTGDTIDVYPREGRTVRSSTGELVAEFALKTETLLDEVRAGGRIPLIIGRGLTSRARAALGRDADVSDVFAAPTEPDEQAIGGYTLAQKIVGRACGLPGVRPGRYCEPKVATIGSQDTTGPMTRDEIRSLACLDFGADLVMQSFCHTAAYPTAVDKEMHRTLPGFIEERGGVSLRPGDGVIHAWLNRMLIPDTVGTGGDSHTRFPLGISFPAGSGMVAFAAATGTLPLDMPESVLVKFTGTRQPGVTLRDLVQAIPYMAVKRGLLTLEKEGKENVFSGRILEIEGLPDLKVEQAFELTDASAERSAAGCTMKLNTESVIEYLRSNVVLLKWMISEGYGDAHTLERRVERMEDWLANPQLLEADADAEYAAVLEINMDEITEPILAVPNDPDASALLSDVAGTKVDEVFVGSCMTSIGHFRAAGELLSDRGANDGDLPAKLWMAPPTKMDAARLGEEGYYDVFCEAGARMELPGCSLCMGNQARVEPGATVVSTSTRNFPNRLGTGAQVYLASAELAAVVSTEGELPSVAKYKEQEAKLGVTKNNTYNNLKFDALPEFVEASKKVKIGKAA